MHLLIELFVKHYSGIESVAKMKRFIIAIPTTVFSQGGVALPGAGEM
jgi:hypothetical protein